MFVNVMLILGELKGQVSLNITGRGRDCDVGGGGGDGGCGGDSDSSG